MTARVQQFEHIVKTELPVLFDDWKLNAQAREKLNGFIKDTENWMAGVLEWHKGTRRYDEPSLHKTPTVGRLIHGPKGLGTSAARIASLFAARDAGSQASAPHAVAHGERPTIPTSLPRSGFSLDTMKGWRDRP